MTAVLGLAGSAAAADYNTLRHLTATKPTQVQPWSGLDKPAPVQFVRAVIHPKDGEVWALHARVAGQEVQLDQLSWRSGAVEQDTAAFGRAFDEELKKAGFSEAGESGLFDEQSGSADLKVAVLVDDMKGRFCDVCPTLLAPKTPPATVLMTAHWEIYSAVDRKVIAKVTTSGGVDYNAKFGSSFLGPVLESFRENVRQLLASEDFRQAVTAKAGAAAGATSAPPSVTAISLRGPTAGSSVARAAESVAIVYAADGQGSGFLVSSDGYVLTNQHVVGGSKYVKLKWAEGAETVGEVVRSDRRRDVALIKTTAPGRSPLALRPGPVQQGETVFAIGTPLDDKLQNTMTKGIVSAERIEDGQRLIQSDAGINHGNSGGPLIDDKGRVIAIAVSGLLPGSHQMGLNFFIPIDDALKVLMLRSGPVEGPAPASATPARIAKKR